MKKLIFFFAALLIGILSNSCKKEGRIDHIDMNAPAPAQISDVQVLANPGGAILTYKIPIDPNISYVKAVYEIQLGVFREAKSSIYTDTLSLVGYGDTLSHVVKIYSVGKNEKESVPILINISPLAPPVKTVFKDLELIASFGGVRVLFKNAEQANLAIVLMIDSTGQNTWSKLTTFYTKALEGGFSARGLVSKESKYAVFVRDRWNNKSDTLIKLLTPLYEEVIPKANFKAVHLPTDTYLPAATYILEHAWDGKINDFPYIFASSNSSTLPQWFTMDLGAKYQISRFKEHQFLSVSHLYYGSAVKTFEIWGSNSPDVDGGWTQWQLLGSFHSFKPSGLPLGKTTIEDSNYAYLNGEDFEFDNVVPAIRYLRFKTLETYSSSGQVIIAELDFWGKLVP